MSGIKEVEANTCYARGVIQYSFTFISGALSAMYLAVLIWGKWGTVYDLYGGIIFGIFMDVIFIYNLLLCIFYKVEVEQNRIVYTNIFNRTVYIDPKDINDITNVDGGKGKK
ncbi:MAG: hypothetical protein K6G87_03435 [Butyrivibrio sp.]|uniref:hypothetical protein n=1 Tax=Butyrivibrio sp. TaxID=28121 RepID=UPI0025CCB3F6|nr:hypothetical protein [Butyrivibrio sp.]MCR5770271.1 hypothetical protein [Butyrivibrio sp.]